MNESVQTERDKMKLDLVNRSGVEKEIVGALKNAIDSHGAITLSNRHSAAKRIYCALKAIAREEKRRRENASSLSVP